MVDWIFFLIVTLMKVYGEREETGERESGREGLCWSSWRGIELFSEVVRRRKEMKNEGNCTEQKETKKKEKEGEVSRTNQDWCTSALKKMKAASPLSLKVALKSIREGRFQTLDECLVREYRMSLHGISKPLSHEFVEGVRAKLVDKDCAPKWDPPTLKDVPDDMVDNYFSPLNEFEELKLPTHLREAFI